MMKKRMATRVNTGQNESLATAKDKDCSLLHDKVKPFESNGDCRDCTLKEGQLSIAGESDPTVDDDDSEVEKLQQKGQKHSKAERELKKLAFDNKKFNLDASDAHFPCSTCGVTFLYDVQLQSHGVYAHTELKEIGATPPDGDAKEPSLGYRCNVCCMSMPNVQSYLEHVDVVGCRSEKRRLKALDSCVCLLCGFATTRNQLGSHLRDIHENDVPTLAPTAKMDGVFSCPMCASEGSSVVVATSNDLLLHMSTWHPTAIQLEKRSRMEEDAYEHDDKKQRTRKLVADGRRFCHRCRTSVVNRDYSKHRRLCSPKVQGEKDSLAKRKSNVKRLPINLIETAVSTSTVKPATLRQMRKCLKSRSEEEARGRPSKESLTADELVQRALEANEGPASSSPSRDPASKKAVFEKLSSVWAKTTKPWKKPYSCLNCRKEFPEPLSYLIHMVSRFCYGNRGQLESSFCPLCDEVLKTAPAALDHLRRCHCGLDGFNVDKSVRVEFSELASEIIGFRYICAKCGRGFHAKTRCNPYRAHAGTKIPLQQMLICKVCSQRVKSHPQLVLHLWAMHNLGNDQFEATMTAACASTENLLKVETVAACYARRAYESARYSKRKSEKEVSLLLKCSSCTTRFASMAALAAHNKEFHDDHRRDDADFQLVAKVFFYRQNEPCGNGQSLFDDMLANASNISSQNVTSASSGCSSAMTSESAKKNVTVRSLPVEQNSSPAPVQRKRRLASLGDEARAKKPAAAATVPKPLLSSSCTNDSTNSGTFLAPPPLTRIPVATITLDDDDASRVTTPPEHTFRENVGSVNNLPTLHPGNKDAASGFVSANCTTSSSGLSVRPVCQQPNSPVVIRAFSLRSTAGPVLVPQMTSHFVLASNTVRLRPPGNVIGALFPHTAAAVDPTFTTTGHSVRHQLAQKIAERQITPVPAVRFTTPLLVSVRAPNLTAASPGMTSPRFVIRAVSQNTATEKA